MYLKSIAGFHNAPQPSQVQSRMQKLVVWLNSKEALSMHPTQMAATAHYMLVRDKNIKLLNASVDTHVTDVMGLNKSSSSVPISVLHYLLDKAQYSCLEF